MIGSVPDNKEKKKICHGRQAENTLVIKREAGERIMLANSS